jgi:hypothetical protein
MVIESEGQLYIQPQCPVRRNLGINVLVQKLTCQLLLLVIKRASYAEQFFSLLKFENRGKLEIADLAPRLSR